MKKTKKIELHQTCKKCGRKKNYYIYARECKKYLGIKIKDETSIETDIEGCIVCSSTDI